MTGTWGMRCRLAAWSCSSPAMTLWLPLPPPITLTAGTYPWAPFVNMAAYSPGRHA